MIYLNAEPLQSLNLAKIGPASLVFVKNGLNVSSTIMVTSTGLGIDNIYNYVFSLPSTGVYFVFSNGEFLGQVEVVTKSVYSYLQDVEDEALGSWQWNKTSGTLNLLRQDGTSLANFAVIDTLTESSRERTS